MKLVLFSKMFKDRSPEDLVEFACALGIDGYDLCVRPGYPVDPANASGELPKVAALMRRSGLDVPMVTGNFDLLEPEHPTARPILAAMDRADVRLLKLGYYKYDPDTQSYTDEVERVRGIFARWEPLAREHNVKICYHTHSGRCMGLNCAALAHLLSGFDPACLGAYIDPGHMVVAGEDFAMGTAMVREHLSIVAVKDVLIERGEADESKNNGAHGRATHTWVEAGRGMVDWTGVFERLRMIGFDGPVSIHCEFKSAEGEFADAVGREVAFFRRMLGR